MHVQSRGQPACLKAEMCHCATKTFMFACYQGLDIECCEAERRGLLLSALNIITTRPPTMLARGSDHGPIDLSFCRDVAR